MRRSLWLAVLGLGCARPATNTTLPEGTDPASSFAPLGSSQRLPVTAPEDAPAGSSSVSETAPAARDKGIFSELDARIQPQLPSWLGAGPLDVWREREADPGWVLVSGVPVIAASASQQTTVQGAPLAAHDLDEDGIPDAYDILLGAKKVELNGAEYRSTYLSLPYPGGDVPRSEGVCTDVVVRALRNAGIDLQQAIHEDATEHPERYPEIQKRDPNIDHRRVKNMLPWFVHHWDALDTRLDGSADPWLPGDVVFFETLPAPGPDHLGIVSDEAGESGRPLVINNWTTGYQEKALDLLPSIPVTHRFRVPRARLSATASSSGLLGLLERHGLSLEDELGNGIQQVVLVVAGQWDESAARLYRFERTTESSDFVQAGEPLLVRLGASGLGVGLGLHSDGKPSTPHAKQEGDKRSPAGIFRLGTAFGREAKPPTADIRWPWRQTQRGDVFVDDPKSKSYNQWRFETPEHDWRSREDLTQYELGIVVEHNSQHIPGRGSAIFIHSIASSRPTTGCTGLPLSDLKSLLRWLSPDKHPVLVQLAGALYSK